MHAFHFCLKFLGRSPVLETIIIVPCIHDTEYLLEILVELMKFQRASKTNIDFVFGEII